MQLKSNRTLAMAAASLMTASNISSVSASDWSQEVSTLLYSESDERVSDKSIKYRGVGTFSGGDKIVTLNAGLDVLTGASPSGTVTSTDSTQIITSSSGGNTTSRSNYGAFSDTRAAFSASIDQAVDEKQTRGNVGFSFSKENDYLHLGLSAGASKELNNRNTTLSTGIAYSADTVSPIGDTPTVLSAQDSVKQSGSESKNVFDAIIGLTQVLSKDSVLQLNYGYSQQDGYLNDPYKLVSRVNIDGSVSQNIYESRPNSRIGHNLYGSIKHSFENKNILSTSARLHTDDWGINSSTAEIKYRVKFNDKKSIEPHIRYYKQSAADFYVPQLNATSLLPTYASADYRLAEFSSYTIGSTFRWKGSGGREWRVTEEFYSQNPTKVALKPSQAGIEANPGFNAVMLSVSVKF